MRLMHLSDLHLGKKVCEFSMLEDQKYILEQILRIAEEKKAEGILICGDIYDKPVPPAEAVGLFDEFLTRLSEREIPVFIISGNHDSAQRLAFGARLMAGSRIYFSGVFCGAPEKITLQDAYGPLNLYLLPFIKPSYVRNVWSDSGVKSYQDAMDYVMQQTQVDTSERNILLAHQFVTGAVRSESEEVNVGGLDQVDVSLFDRFDYVALGHIHGPQTISRETVRYCGTPLKYSFSEAGQQKSVTLVDLKKKGDVEISTVPLIPLRDLREIRGSYAEVTLKKNYEGTPVGDYLHITLTDEEDILDAMNKLHSIYLNLMKLDYDNQRTRETQIIEDTMPSENRSPMQLFEEFYEKQNNQPMNEEQTGLLKKLIDEIWEEEQ